MMTLVVGANGATGRLLVEQLLMRGQTVKIIVRSTVGLPETVLENERLIITVSNLLDMSDDQLLAHVEGCTAVVSCLGHNLTFKGMFGHPKRLVTDAAQRLCKAIQVAASVAPVKFVLMNTTGNQNKQAREKVSFSQRILVGLIRHLLPPHFDNEAAADYLQSNFDSKQSQLEWVAVRPDSLIDLTAVTHYELYPSPIRSAIFDAGKTSRINVAHFMSELVTDNQVWEKWKFQMPVIYN